MPHRKHHVKVKHHPGSSAHEIANEPDWSGAHSHRVGFRNRDDRAPGLTVDEHQHELEDEDERGHAEAAARAKAQLDALDEERAEGRLVNFREVVERQDDLHLRYPADRPVGWRYVLSETEDWVKNGQDWPANLKKRSEEKQKKDEEGKGKHEGDEKEEKGKGEHEGDHGGDKKEEMEKEQQQEKDDEGGEGDEGDEDDKQLSPREQALLESLEGERKYVEGLQMNDGSGRAMPRNLRNRTDLSIDEQDQFTPDNWLPRAPGLVRLTGKHPLNAEPRLTDLFDAGLITPNELHYVRNHGSVPRILWEMHRVDVEVDGGLGLGPGARLSLSMDDIKDGFEAVSFPVFLACDGNRRKELNMIRKGKGFNWGAGAVGCAYWKGALLRDVLARAGIAPDDVAAQSQSQSRQLWVNFCGRDELSEGTYETCIPLAYAMNPHNDVLLAYEMNGVNLPPDHGYPVRVVIPGFVGGRCVKWLRRIWITERENSSHYHVWDNRVVPSFVRTADEDDPLARAMFHHPDTKCNEQNLNSVIVRPAHGETVSLGSARGSYRIAGYAYDGGGIEVQRVEVSLDGGDEWLYCVRTFPDEPVRHGTKFWTWLHWHVDVDMAQLLDAKSITVRAFNATKNTQPERPVWNVMGMMNNAWYVVRPEIQMQQEGQEDSGLAVVFRHPVEPGAREGGWMRPSEENRIAEAKQEAGTPEKQFTREEIEKHSSADDCWIVVDGKVYDATSVLDWHPGGKAAILPHAGKVHQQTTNEFASIHDDYAYGKLKECILGSVTDKAKQFMKKSAEAAAKEAAASGGNNANEKLALKKHRWVPIRLLERQNVSHDTRKYTFRLPDGKDTLGLGTCQHVLIGFHMPDRMLIRSYTPTRPLLPPHAGETTGGDEKQQQRKTLEDGHATFDLTIKTYFPDDNQPGGALSNILDCIPIGEEVEMRGPTGEIIYEGGGTFTLGEGQQRHFSRVSLVLGGSGVTPGFALIARILLSADDKTQLRVVDANKSEDDILMRAELDRFEKEAKDGQLRITHVLSHPSSDDWIGRRGHVDADLLRDALFPPDKDSVVFLCGPPAMIQKAALPALRDWGYVEDENMFGF